jgi:hypothetical protein
MADPEDSLEVTIVVQVTISARKFTWWYDYFINKINDQRLLKGYRMYVCRHTDW